MLGKEYRGGDPVQGDDQQQNVLKMSTSTSAITTRGLQLTTIVKSRSYAQCGFRGGNRYAFHTIQPETIYRSIDESILRAQVNAKYCTFVRCVRLYLMRCRSQRITRIIRRPGRRSSFSKFCLLLTESNRDVKSAHADATAPPQIDTSQESRMWTSRSVAGDD